MREHHDLVLAIHASPRSVAYTLFERPLAPMAWGITRISGKQRNAKAFETARNLIDRFHPDVIVLRDVSTLHTGRSRPVRRLHHLIVSHAAGQTIEVHRYSRRHIRACFKAVGATTRYEIAQAIASQIDAFKHRLPPVRKVWRGEDERMKLFEAASLVMTFYHRDATQKEDA